MLQLVLLVSLLESSVCGRKIKLHANSFITSVLAKYGGKIP